MPLKKASAVIIISLLIAQTASADFTDVKIAHPNYTAIQYLQNDGTLQGYADGSFKPENKVNRAEFLKIIIEGSKIPTDISEETPFKDVDHQAWYGPYIKKAFHEGWITGYGDGTFRPEQTINKVEALKITAKAQNWPLNFDILIQPFPDTPIDAWYTTYVSFAQNHNFLTEQENFVPNESMTRAKISEIIYRSKIEGISPSTNTDSEPITEIIEDINETNPNTSVSENYFSNITLTETLPTTFYKNEIYIVKGKSDTNSSIVSVVLDNKTQTSKKTFTAETINGDFTIPVFFNQSGNYQIGVINGSSGSTNAKAITILDTIAESNTETAPEKATNLSINFENQRSQINFSQTPNTLKKLSFTQGQNQLTLYNRQNINKIPLSYRAFNDFEAGQMSFTVDLATANINNTITRTSDFTKSETKTFQATNHEFSIIENDETNTKAPYTLSSSNQNITFSGKTFVDINVKAFVITPDQQIETVNLTTNSPKSTYYNSDTILANGTFNFDYDPKTNGTYIVEVNNKNGQAIINQPVYVNAGIPLIPNYFDLNPRKFFSGTLNLTNARTELLDLINQARTSADLSQLTLDDQLNTLAQAHSQDMADNDYFAHINLQGQTANDRRIAAGITTAVGENIAIDTSIPNGHLALMRSAAHLRNIVEPSWTRVGIGIVVKDGYLTISEEFSSKEITEADITNYENSLFTTINNERSKANLATLTKDQKLTSASQSLNNKVEQGSELNNTLFTETLEENSVTGASQAIIRSYSIWQDIIDSIILDEKEAITTNSWQKIGIDVKKSDVGILLYTTLILNTP